MRGVFEQVLNLHICGDSNLEMVFEPINTIINSTVDNAYKNVEEACIRSR